MLWYGGGEAREHGGFPGSPNQSLLAVTSGHSAFAAELALDKFPASSERFLFVLSKVV